MTQALHITQSVNKVQNLAGLYAYSFTEHRQAIRSAIVAARPVMSDEQSRRAKRYIAGKIWRQSVPLTGSIAEVYFGQYGVICDPDASDHVRFNSAVLHEPTRETLPAVIAPVHDLNGEFVGIHKTYLAADGKGKANVGGGDARRLLGDCKGAHIQLCEATGFRLVVTESIETALLIQQSCPGFPVWSAMTPANMRAPVPASVKEVILCPDGCDRNKETNVRLVRDAVREHMDRGIRVLLAPHVPGINYGDLL